MTIGSTLGDLVTGLAEAFSSALSSVASIFFTSGTEGITLQPLGYIALIGLALSIIYFAINLVVKLVRVKK